MNYYFITGTSRGIGKAIAELLLMDANNKVIGISREQSISNPNYKHITFDLSDEKAITNFQFQVPDDAKKVCLINNAGAIGQIKPLGEIDSISIVKVFTINTIAPSVLSNNFIAQLANHSARKTILNVSSGAGKRAIESWATYCASKAAIDLFSETIAKEHPEIRVYSIAPGLVDTQMQVEIRSANKEDFKYASVFKGYHDNGELNDPNTVAEKYIKILNNPTDYPDVVFSLRDIE